ncbi:MAG: response regulator [bacterium]|nr:response regulator [bacterium]
MSDKAKVLIIDDDADVREIASRVLGGEGYQVITATSGPEGIEKARQEVPKLILMDISMPDMDGYEATKLLKQDPSLSLIPVIFLTGRSASEDDGQAFASGGVSYICKPFTGQQLKDMVNLAIMSLSPRT